MAVKTAAVEQTDEVLEHLFRTSPPKPRIVEKRNAVHVTPQSLPALHEGTELDKDAVLIPRDSIEPSTLNARHYFAPDALKELGESLKADGQLQAIVVRVHPRKDGKYEIVIGERRWRAAGAKYGDVPMLRCHIGNYTDEEVRRLSLNENIKRESLRPMEIAKGLMELKADVKTSLRWNEIAASVGKTRQWVNDYVSLLAMAPMVQEAVDVGKLTIYQATAMRQLEHPQQVKAAQLAIRDNMSVREIEQGVRAVLGKPAPAKRETPQQQPPTGNLLTGDFTAPRPAIEGPGFIVPNEHSATAQTTTTGKPIAGTPQGTYQPRQPQIDCTAVLDRIIEGLTAIVGALPAQLEMGTGYYDRDIAPRLRRVDELVATVKGIGEKGK